MMWNYEDNNSNALHINFKPLTKRGEGGSSYMDGQEVPNSMFLLLSINCSSDGIKGGYIEWRIAFIHNVTIYNA